MWKFELEDISAGLEWRDCLRFENAVEGVKGEIWGLIKRAGEVVVQGKTRDFEFEKLDLRNALWEGAGDLRAERGNVKSRVKST